MKVNKIIALGSFKTTAADLKGNSALMISLCKEAAAQGKELILFPELALTGTDCQDLFLNRDFKQKCTQALLTLVKELPEGLTVGFGTALTDTEGAVRDAYVFAKDGQVQAVFCARGFTRGPNEYRDRYFVTSKDKCVFALDGRVLVESRGAAEIDGCKVKVLFDVGFAPHNLGGCDLLVMPSARTYEVEGIESAVKQVTEVSERTKALVAAPNLCGNENGGAVLDGVCLLARRGQLLVKSPACFFADTKLITAESGITPAEHPYDEMMRTVALGLYDFMFKSRAKGFALSLSGGADSALCASSVAIAQLCAINELGAEEYLKRLSALGLEFPEYSGDPIAYVKGTLMPKLLTTVYQGSDNSSDVTRTASRMLASGVGSSHHEWSISKVVNDYVELYNSISAGNPLSWEHDDITLQNIQARSRLPGIWMVANRESKLLLETSNLSEASVGYCTMDGDTAGGIAPISGIGKSIVRRINVHLQTEGFKVSDSLIFKIPEMSYITAQAPTAELRPGGQQTDEGDVMPYVVLDFIRRAFAQDRAGPAEILALLKNAEEFREIEPAKLTEYVKRYFLMHSRSQWKRERFAVGIHIEKDDSSPKGYWRFPIFDNDLKVLTEDL